MGKRNGVFLGNVAKGFASGVKIGLEVIEAPLRVGRAQQAAEAQAARVENTMRSGANLTDDKAGTFTAPGGPVNYDNTVKARAVRLPRLRKLR